MEASPPACPEVNGLAVASETPFVALLDERQEEVDPYTAYDWTIYYKIDGETLTGDKGRTSEIKPDSHYWHPRNRAKRQAVDALAKVDQSLKEAWAEVRRVSIKDEECNELLYRIQRTEEGRIPLNKLGSPEWETF